MRSRLVMCALAATMLALAACSGTTTAVPTPSPFQRGQWQRPAFGGTGAVTASTVAFAAADRVGYACVATLSPASAPTATVPTATPITPPTATPAPAATPTLVIPGRTPPPVGPTIANAFWRSPDGGITWQPATLPANLPQLLCPASAIVASDPADPNAVFFLAAQGAVDVTSPTPVLPTQLSYSLWRSADGGQTWAAVPLPTVPGLGTPVVLSPYHLIIIAHGPAIALASNYSGADALFTTTDGGQTWTRHSAAELTAPDDVAPVARVFAGFAAGAGGSVLALATDAAIAPTDHPYELWRSADDGATWTRIGRPLVSFISNGGASAQLFAAPNGTTLYLVAHATFPGAVPAAAPQTTLVGSQDGGVTWSSGVWPASPTVPGDPAGGAIIAALGQGFAVDANGTAYFAPSNSDLDASVDPKAPYSAGIFSTTVVGMTGGITLSGPTAPTSAASTVLNLAVSLVPPAALAPTPAGTAAATATATFAATLTPTAGATTTATPPIAVTDTPAAPTATPTAPGTATATPGATATATLPAPTATPDTTDLATVWATFGPLELFAVTPATTGTFLNVLP